MNVYIKWKYMYQRRMYCLHNNLRVPVWCDIIPGWINWFMFWSGGRLDAQCRRDCGGIYENMGPWGANGGIQAGGNRHHQLLLVHWPGTKPPPSPNITVNCNIVPLDKLLYSTRKWVPGTWNELAIWMYGISVSTVVWQLCLSAPQGVEDAKDCTGLAWG